MQCFHQYKNQPVIVEVLWASWKKPHLKWKQKIIFKYVTFILKAVKLTYKYKLNNHIFIHKMTRHSKMYSCHRTKTEKSLDITTFIQTIMWNENLHVHFNIYHKMMKQMCREYNTNYVCSIDIQFCS